MRNVRIWFTKEKECKYISHLDLNRCMLRAVRRAELPMWYTEGFNPHPFVTFPLPISLGVTGMRECMDIRIIDENFNIGLIPDRMNKYLPEGIRVFDATEPKFDPKYISYAKYHAEISSDDMTSSQLADSIKSLFNRETVIIQKKSKKGMKDIDVLPYIKEINFNDRKDICSFDIILPAGNTKNIALSLIIKALENELSTEIFSDIYKLDMFCDDMVQFA